MKIKKYILLFAFLAFSVMLFSSCAAPETKSDKISVITTLFPQYDFAKTIAQDKADIKLLLKPGVDSHSYEPTSSDMIEISNADLFIYTGNSMETWAKTILDSVDSSTLKTVDVSNGINLVTVAEEHHENAAHDEHDSIYDPHIWTDPQNAKIIVKNISDALCAADEKNAGFYRQNAENLLNELDKLDSDFEAFFSSCENKTIVFGSRFAMYYFAKRYGLNCIAAFDTCSGEGEASPGKIAELCEIIKKNNLKAVYYEELSDPSVANTIAAETNTKALLLHSCHNVSESDFNSGKGYISLMRQNLENLKQGMN